MGKSGRKRAGKSANSWTAHAKARLGTFSWQFEIVHIFSSEVNFTHRQSTIPNDAFYFWRFQMKFKHFCLHSRNAELRKSLSFIKSTEHFSISENFLFRNQLSEISTTDYHLNQFSLPFGLFDFYQLIFFLVCNFYETNDSFD